MAEAATLYDGSGLTASGSTRTAGSSAIGRFTVDADMTLSQIGVVIETLSTGDLKFSCSKGPP
ncbi:MAG: hypothetical protein ACJAVS_001578 [Paracoccaceae bacterium]|jgi:hypothetical protein